MEILYEDNHIIIVNKQAGEIIQGDKTGDRTVADEIKAYLKEKYNKPGAVFLGIPHRLDRPVSGVSIFARTSKALARLNEMFRKGEIEKTYQAIVIHEPQIASGTLEHWLTRNEKQNKAYAHKAPQKNAKKAILDYKVEAKSDRYWLINVQLHTGRHHQIRCQLAAIGCPIKGDLKYGAPRSNADGSICLHARSIRFEHPVSHKIIFTEAPYPSFPLWNVFQKLCNESEQSSTTFKAKDA
ncbi:RluA family pseudouridine synthase [Alloprevotella tannerae]|uniref:RluA family pseudouridine synthase n=1 Tax=Alloprevotella tannerae TaxID=76122 RepID=UPI001EDB2E20|nr:RluA family pseudouridine synthase [Alloprevotella tannerae]MCG2651517.1 RluA family pseudouridine synthase [Alloprevotella tannerae]